MNSGPRQKFCDDAFVYLGVLPHVQTGQVKAEHLHRFSEPIESIVGDGLVTETTQRGVDDSEIPLQLCRVGVRLESVVGPVGGQLPQYRQCCGAQAPADTANRATVRLIGLKAESSPEVDASRSSSGVTETSRADIDSSRSRCSSSSR